MNYNITFTQPYAISVALPASKSLSNRMLILNALSGNAGQLSNIADCNDTNAMLNALGNKGQHIDIGAAGTAMRFLTAYYACQLGKDIIIDGSERMRHRPIGVLVNALRQCGAEIYYEGEEGFPPLHIKGKTLNPPVKLQIPANISSQYISALMMIAPVMGNDMNIELTGELVSRPYIEMTASLMRSFGATIDFTNQLISIRKGCYKKTDCIVESDWSAASYWYEIKALLPDCNIKLLGLHRNSLQGDNAVAKYFESFGVISEFTEDGVILHSNPSSKAERIAFNLSKQPDLTQTIVATSCLLGIPFNIKGLSTLKIKETDRIEALKTELHKLGFAIEGDNDSMQWNGKRIQADKAIEINTYDDHRMAMSLAPVSILFPNLTIKDIEVVKKSYPDYWKHISAIGFKLNETK